MICPHMISLLKPWFLAIGSMALWLAIALWLIQYRRLHRPQRIGAPYLLLVPLVQLLFMALAWHIARPSLIIHLETFIEFGLLALFLRVLLRQKSWFNQIFPYFLGIAALGAGLVLFYPALSRLQTLMVESFLIIGVSLAAMVHLGDIFGKTDFTNPWCFSLNLLVFATIMLGLSRLFFLSLDYLPIRGLNLLEDQGLMVIQHTLNLGFQIIILVAFLWPLSTYRRVMAT